MCVHACVCKHVYTCAFVRACLYVEYILKNIIAHTHLSGLTRNNSGVCVCVCVCVCHRTIGSVLEPRLLELLS